MGNFRNFLTISQEVADVFYDFFPDGVCDVYRAILDHDPESGIFNGNCQNCEDQLHALAEVCALRVLPYTLITIKW